MGGVQRSHIVFHNINFIIISMCTFPCPYLSIFVLLQLILLLLLVSHGWCRWCELHWIVELLYSELPLLLSVLWLLLVYELLILSDVMHVASILVLHRLLLLLLLMLVLH